MNTTDLTYLTHALEAFIAAAINRLSVSGDLTYTFRIPAAELKAQTDRQRLHEAVIQDVIGFFKGHGVRAQYDQELASFAVTIDLNTCVLSPPQANYFSTAMETFRANS
ncbi:hypothetical protein [Ralstonia pseudosolanacearum]|uniref:hypothetical protein n=1 Tax=Ralstonia pseudosolanacearum TaxID=1310165 RepID=UPI003CF714A7